MWTLRSALPNVSGKRSWDSELSHTTDESDNVILNSPPRGTSRHSFSPGAMTGMFLAISFSAGVDSDAVRLSSRMVVPCVVESSALRRPGFMLSMIIVLVVDDRGPSEMK